MLLLLFVVVTDNGHMAMDCFYFRSILSVESIYKG